MKRFHVHVNVDQLDSSIRFYSTLFGAAPSVVKPDCTKWMLDDPRINFAIPQRGRAAGVNHLGLQAEDDGELAAIAARLQSADAIALAGKATNCCYARSDTFWADNPHGVRWEGFRTLGEVTAHGGAVARVTSDKDGSCGGSAASLAPITSCGADASGG
jgi:catechol 2,3-dioxygenase-like lactoylglutathione lyase family enzyme